MSDNTEGTAQAITEKILQMLEKHKKVRDEANELKIAGVRRLGAFVPVSEIAPPYPGIECLVKTENGRVHVSHMISNQPPFMPPLSDKDCVWTVERSLGVKVVEWMPIPLSIEESIARQKAERQLYAASDIEAWFHDNYGPHVNEVALTHISTLRKELFYATCKIKLQDSGKCVVTLYSERHEAESTEAALVWATKRFNEKFPLVVKGVAGDQSN